MQITLMRTLLIQQKIVTKNNFANSPKTTSYTISIVLKPTMK